MNCLLPIDWLELVESGADGSMKDHLSSCASCRAIVENLRGAASETAFSNDWTSTLDLDISSPWVLFDPDEVRSGQIWLTRESFVFNTVSYSNLDRVFVLVLDDPVEEHDWQWVDVAPLLTDTDSATSTDLLLDARHSTLDAPMGAYLRYQTLIATSQLDACIGALTDEGREVLQQVKAGDFDGARFGAALESANDSRLTRTDFLRDAFDQLAAVYPAVEAQSEALAEAFSEKSNPVAADVFHNVLEAVTEHVTRVLELKVGRPPSFLSGYPAQLAAASELEDVNPLSCYFSVAESDLELAGTLELKGDDLTFGFDAVRGLSMNAHVVVCVVTRTGKPLASPVVQPHEGTVVIVASGESVLPIEVDAVQVKLGA